MRRGEIFGFLGPNGAGKSTSIKMLLGLAKPTGGEAWVLGAPAGNVEVRRKIGFLPENFRFYEWLTPAELLHLHGRLCGVPASQLAKRVPALIDLVGLTPHSDKRLQNFSKGMLQRIGLAQALVHEPDLIFLDEPTSGLDPLGRRMVRDIIRAQRERGATVFLNSHMLSEIEITCDQVVFIREGEVVTSRDMRAQHEEAVRVEVRARKLSQECVAGLARWSALRAGGRRAADADGAVARRASRNFALSRRGGRRGLPVHAAAHDARGTVHERHGRGSGILMGVWIMAGITFREAARKKILWTALLAGVAFLIVFGIGLHFQVDDFRNSSVPPFLRYQVVSAMLMIGLYTVDLLAVVMTTLTSVDTIAGEITSGTIHAIATKPLDRWQILIGKWLGFVAMAGGLRGADLLAARSPRDTSSAAW